MGTVLWEDQVSCVRLKRGGDYAGWRGFEPDYRALRAIEDKVFASAGEPDLPVSRVRAWYEANPDIYTLLLTRTAAGAESVAGYLCALPLKRPVFEALRKGELEEACIPADAVEPYHPCRPGLNLYLGGIALDPELARSSPGGLAEGASLLIRGWTDLLIENRRRHGVEVRAFVAVAWSLQGERISRLFGMRPAGKDPRGRTLYYLEVEPGAGASLSETTEAVGGAFPASAR
jgi:hypothetical protein